MALQQTLIDNRDEIVRMCEADSLIRLLTGAPGRVQPAFSMIPDVVTHVCGDTAFEQS